MFTKYTTDQLRRALADANSKLLTYTRHQMKLELAMREKEA